MSDKWVLFLGANSDMAVSAARKFASEGYNIFLASRDLGACNNEAKNIRIRYRVSVEAMQFDASDYMSHEDFYSRLPARPIGVILAFGQMYEQADAQNSFSLARKMIEVNYLGSVSILEIITRDFEINGGEFIIGVSSVAGDRGRMSNYIYGSTKSALTTYLSGLAHRMSKSKISVITVKPGFVYTKMTNHLMLPAMLTASSNEVGEAIFGSINKGPKTIYVKRVWRLIMLLIVHIPSFIFHKTKL